MTERNEVARGPVAPSIRTLATLVRASQWWDYKLAPILVIFYATLVREGASLALEYREAATLLVGLIAGAAYVSISNDIADRRDDRIAGKANRLEGLSHGTIALLLAFPVSIGGMVAWHWRDDVLLLLAYGGAWLAFTAYSLPPFRLKARGAAGVMADALGSQCLPSIVATLAAARGIGHAPDLAWVAAVAVWSGAYGVRGILWHQLHDAAADRASNTGTFVQRHGAIRTRTFVSRFLFPLELVALAAVLAMIPGRASLAGLALYGLFAIGKIERFKLRAVLVEPVDRYLLILFDFYIVFWPITLLIAAAISTPLDAGVLAAQLLLFPVANARTLRDGIRLSRRVLT